MSGIPVPFKFKTAVLAAHSVTRLVRLRPSFVGG